MSLKLNGATNGSIELDVPDAIGSDLNITIPATAGEVAVKATDGSVDLGDVNIDSSGRLLVGTSSALSAGSPANASVQIVGRANSSTDEGRLTIARGEPATKPLSTDNIIGRVFFTDNVGNEFATIGCYVDQTSGSGDYPGRLVFSTTADGASSPTERMRITSSGHVLINKTATDVTTPGHELRTGSGQHVMGKSFSGTVNGIYFHHNSTYVGGLNYTNTGTALATSSDYRIKENVVKLPDATSRVKQLNPIRFNFISEPDQTVEGFIAHELGEVVAEACFGEKDAVNEDGSIKPQSIAQEKLIPLLTAALQEAIAKIETLEAKVAALEANP